MVLLAFPLYTDAMPGIVKSFIEALQPLCGRENLPKLGFLVQSEFQEPIHCRYVEGYLEKLAGRLGCDYLGAIVRGGVEGIQMMPPFMTRKLYRLLYQLGQEFSRTGRLDSTVLKKLAPREKNVFFSNARDSRCS